MDTKATLEADLKEAMKSGDETRKRTIRMALAAIRQAEVDRQTSLDEGAVIGLLQKEIKSRTETIEEARRANRADIITATEAEVAILQAYLPQAMSAEELGILARTVIAEVGASSLADMGKVMKALLPRVAGRASGDQVSATVRQLLQSQ